MRIVDVHGMIVDTEHRANLGFQFADDFQFALYQVHPDRSRAGEAPILLVSCTLEIIVHPADPQFAPIYLLDQVQRAVVGQLQAFSVPDPSAGANDGFQSCVLTGRGRINDDYETSRKQTTRLGGNRIRPMKRESSLLKPTMIVDIGGCIRRTDDRHLDSEGERCGQAVRSIQDISGGGRGDARSLRIETVSGERIDQCVKGVEKSSLPMLSAPVSFEEAVENRNVIEIQAARPLVVQMPQTPLGVDVLGDDVKTIG